MYNKKNGFTLIEVLVVVAIIGLLSSVTLASLGNARVKAKDALRKQHFQQLGNALELYYQDNGRYPVTCSPSDCADPWRSSLNSNWIPSLASKYISVLPKEPSQDPSICDADGRSYRYISDGINYKIQIHCPDSPYILATPNTDKFWDPDITGHSSSPPGNPAKATWMTCRGPGCPTIFNNIP